MGLGHSDFELKDVCKSKYNYAIIMYFRGHVFVSDFTNTARLWGFLKEKEIITVK